MEVKKQCVQCFCMCRSMVFVRSVLHTARNDRLLAIERMKFNAKKSHIIQNSLKYTTHTTTLSSICIRLVGQSVLWYVYIERKKCERI